MLNLHGYCEFATSKPSTIHNWMVPNKYHLKPFAPCPIFSAPRFSQPGDTPPGLHSVSKKAPNGSSGDHLWPWIFSSRLPVSQSRFAMQRSRSPSHCNKPKASPVAVSSSSTPSPPHGWHGRRPSEALLRQTRAWNIPRCIPMDSYRNSWRPG